MRRLRARLLAVAVAAFAPLGCVIDSDPDPVPEAVVVPTVPAEGTVVVDWTISGVTDPAQCRQGGAEVIILNVYFEDGALAGTFEQRCDVFATSIRLAAGRYTASALLVDVNRQPRTTTVLIDAFDIFGNDQLSIPIDFPADSFL
jgi:hypothetical protein